MSVQLYPDWYLALCIVFMVIALIVLTVASKGRKR
jgi:hypothetical protein